MRKFVLFICLMLGLTMLGFIPKAVEAVKPQADLTDTRMIDIRMTINYDTSNVPTGIVINTKSLILDATGVPVTTYSQDFKFEDMAPQEQNAIRVFLRFIGKAINNKAVNENVDPQLP